MKLLDNVECCGAAATRKMQIMKHFFPIQFNLVYVFFHKIVIKLRYTIHHMLSKINGIANEFCKMGRALGINVTTPESGYRKIVDKDEFTR